METIIRDEGDLTIVLTARPEPASRRMLKGAIQRFNDAVSPHHQAAREGGLHPLAVLVRDRQKELLGGLTGNTYWGWLEIDDLWLPESLRGQGYGGLLLRVAEDEARKRGCQRVLLRTFGFQALSFYQRQGYQVVGQLEDYPPGECFYWLRKDLKSE